MGKAARFLKEESRTELFLNVTVGGLDTRKMRDRELVNRFCAFRLLGVEEYRRDIDRFLSKCLRRMNGMPDAELASLSRAFRRGLANNLLLFGKQAFREHGPEQERRGVFNAALWDVISTALSGYSEERVEACAAALRETADRLLADKGFKVSITDGPNDGGKVRYRFRVTREKFEVVLGAPRNAAGKGQGAGRRTVQQHHADGYVAVP